jgi:hypothetical protein
MELRTEVEIAAPPSAVWAVVADFPAYAEWNPFIVHVSGEVRVGATLDVTVSPPGGSEMRFRPTVLVADPGRELRWRGQLFFRGLFDGEHFFQLTELPGGRTKLVHGENFTGILVRLLGGALTKTARGFVLMNQALKRRVEDRASSR